MKKQNAQTVGDVLKQFFEEQNLTGKINEKKLIAIWPEILGPQWSTYTTNIFIKNKILYVQLSSSVLRNELMMCREMLIKKLNNRIGAEVITNIIFR